MIRELAARLLISLAHFADKTVCAFANRTDSEDDR